MNKSKLTIIRNYLKDHPNAIILNDEEKSYSFPSHAGARFSNLRPEVCQSVEFKIIPKKGHAPYYKGVYGEISDIVAKRLQEFMLSLIPPGLKPDNIFNFYVSRGNWEGPSTYLSEGWMIFYETIAREKGKKSSVVELVDPELLEKRELQKKLGFVDGKKIPLEIIIDEPLCRRIDVKIIPYEWVTEEIENQTKILSNK